MVASKKQVKAVARTIRISPQKLNLVAESIRGLKVDKALAQLTFSRKRVAGEVKKLLTGAIANAENNFNLPVDQLVLCEAAVDECATIKRYQPVSRGSAHPIRKRTSRIKIVLTSEGQIVQDHKE